MTRSLGAMLVLGAVLRAPGLFTEFWLDEIYALSSASSVGSAAEVVTGIHHDSNHWLMSLWMRCLGPDAAFWAYRLPSYLAGVAAILFVGWLAELDGGKPLRAMLLTATSFPLVFYSSEARGYALAALLALALLLFLVRWFETRQLRFLAASSIAASLGLLSHLSFLMVLAAAFAYSLVLAGRGGASVRNALVPFVLPILLLAALAAINAGHFVIGGGTSGPPGEVLLQTASLAFGGPIEGSAVSLVSVLGILLLVLELARRARAYWPNRISNEARSYLWIFFGSALLVPVWVVLLVDPPFLYPRYFLAVLAFAPLLAASFAGSLPGTWRAALVAAWLLLNGWSFARFLLEGRGRYEEALRFVAESSDREVITIGSDHDFRNGTVVRFYRERMGDEIGRLQYDDAKGTTRPEFWIGSYEGSECEGCRFLRAYPSSSLSGSRWRLYRIP
jgi:uncharacterized membrane protein